MPERSRTSKNPNAAALGRLGGLKGGPARAAKLSGAERSQIARHAANARWASDEVAPRSRAKAGSETARVGGPWGPYGYLVPALEERWHDLVEQIPAVVCIDAMDEYASTVYISPQIEELLGYPVALWREDPGLWYDTLHPQDRDEVFDTYMRNREASDRWTMDYRAISRDGRTVWIREDDRVIRGDDGTPLAVQGVLVDVTRQKEDEERLRQLGRTKEALLHAVSHDLRGPLSAVLGAATLMTTEHVKVGEADRRKLLDGMVASSRRMDHIVANLLDMDRLERGSIKARTVRLDVGELVGRIVEELEVPAGRSILLDQQPVTIQVDPGLVERIVENLVLNALKHTPRGSTVWVRVAPMKNGAEIIVEDDGPGVPEKLRKEIFAPYRRASDEYVTGAGIGLSLVERFAALHGGSAWVEDRAGGGASFHVSFPGPAADG